MRTIITKSILLRTLAIVLVLTASAAAGQEPTKVARVGFLAQVSASAISARIDAFRLRDLGYIEGQNLKIEWRDAGGDAHRLEALAAELVSMKVDVIVTAGPADTRAAKKATSTIPIVMAQDSDPIGNGFIASLARPGGNITGLATQSPEVTGKQLELLKEIVPKLSRVAVMSSSNIPGNAQAVKEANVAASALGLRLLHLDIIQAEEIENAFKAVKDGRAEAILVLGGPVLNTRHTQLTALAARSRLPATYTRPEFVEAGGLMTYGASYNDLYRRAATYVDKIFKGANPADLPVEQPTKFELVINLKTAKQIGLAIPANVLARADRVIK